MKTFTTLYASLGPDVEAIAKELGIKPSSVDRLINQEMDRRYAKRQYRAEQNRRVRAELREIRARHA